MLATLGPRVSEMFGGGRVTVVTNPTIWNIYNQAVGGSLNNAGLSVGLIEIPDGEQHKTLDTVTAIYEQLAMHKHARVEPVIALGGGVVGDMAGFAAATYMRGVPLVHVPTTLLAQVDSSIGGKTGVDMVFGKNLIGAFHQPAMVISDTSVLVTLPDSEVRQGLAEVIKTAFLSGGPLLELCRTKLDRMIALDPAAVTEAVHEAVQFKASVVSQDEFDITGARAILNYGHTVGHALEAAGEYLALTHGDAIAIGMAAAARLSTAIGLSNPELVGTTEDMLKSAGLPVRVPSGITPAKALEAMSADKKRTGKDPKFILLEDIGTTVLVEVEEDAVLRVLEEMSDG